MPTGFHTLAELAAQSCGSHADKPLFGTRTPAGWQWTTYGAFGDLVGRVRGGLAGLGLERGERVGIIADNCVEWAATFYASAGLGLVPVPLYPAQQPDEWLFCLSDSGAAAAVCATTAITRQLADLDLPALRYRIDLEGGEATSWRALASADPVPIAPVDPGSVAEIIYTSGTTGRAKGVVLSHANLCSNVAALDGLFTLEEQTSLSFLPWAHSFGQTAELHALVSMGNAIAVNDRIPNLMRNLAEVRPTMLVAVPRVFNRIWDGVTAKANEQSAPMRSLFESGLDAAYRRNTGASLGPIDRGLLWAADRQIFSGIREKLGGRLKHAISGSAALSPEVARFLVAVGIEVYEGYGLTESSPIAALNHPGARRLGTVGRALPGVRIALDPPDQDDGELVIYGPNVMQGYHGQPDETAAVMTADGGLRTGDLGRIDSEGYITITGRLREQYKLETGRFVVPGPVEAALAMSPYIAQCVVHGRNRPHTVALIVPDTDALRAWAKSNGLGRVDVETNDRVRALLTAEIEARAAPFKPWERPMAFAITKGEFTPQNGLLTQTLKLKRQDVLSRFQEVLDALYS